LSKEEKYGRKVIRLKEPLNESDNCHKKAKIASGRFFLSPEKEIKDIFLKIGEMPDGKKVG